MLYLAYEGRERILEPGSLPSRSLKGSFRPLFGLEDLDTICYIAT